MKYMYHFTVSRYGHLAPTQTYVRKTFTYRQRLHRDEDFQLIFVPDVRRMDILFIFWFREV